MKIKLDHNLSPHLASILEDLGHDVKTANEEGLAKASDAVLLFETTVEGRMLFTLDLGFADVERYPRDTHPASLFSSKEKARASRKSKIA